MTLEIILWIISSASFLTSMHIITLILADDRVLSSLQRAISCIILFGVALLFIMSFIQAISSMIELTIQQLK